MRSGPIMPRTVSSCPFLYSQYPSGVTTFPIKSNTYLLAWVGIGIAERTLSAQPRCMDRNFDQIRLSTLAEAASLLHISTRTRQRMISNQDLPALKVGAQWHVRASPLAEWTERHEGRAIRVSPKQIN
ncbi:MAG: Helix-turn-helix protein [Deltaproteobacteria bacterium]|nr:Helix-turn-helix protein [Deltaproteobacteria bacterium]